MAFFLPDINENWTKPDADLILSSVVALATTKRTYDYTSENGASLRELIFSKDLVLREGDTLTINGPQNRNLQYRLQLLEPARRGRARVGVTAFTLLSPVSFSENLTQDQHPDLELFEIDEGFLAQTVLHPSVESHNSFKKLDHAGYPRSTFRMLPLHSPCHHAEDQWTLYVRTRDLSRLGVLSGGWAIAFVRPSSARAVKIIGNDDVVHEGSTITGSPILLRNLVHGPDENDDGSNVTICPLESYAPTVPIAHCMTIAHVASVFSTNIKWQAAVMDGLTRYFKSSRKLVKRDDLFAVSIDTTAARGVEKAENDDMGGHRLGPSNSDEMAFFKVTNLEYDIPLQHSSTDVDVECASGELGCWVDSNLTRIVQSGHEHAVVPNLSSASRTPDSMHSAASLDPTHRLMHLVSGALFKDATTLKVNTVFLVEGNRGVGKFTAIESTTRILGLHLLEIDCYDIIGDSATKTEATLRVRFEQARAMSPCIVALRHVDALSQTTTGQEKDGSVCTTLVEELENYQAQWKETGYPVIVVATTADSEKIPAALLRCFKQTIKFGAPDETARLGLLKDLLTDCHLSADVLIAEIAIQTASLLALDLRDLIYRTKTASIVGSTLCSDVHRTVEHELLTATDFREALSKARAAYSESIGAPKIPTVSWEDVGGLAHVKTDILDTIQLPLEHPDMFLDGLKKRSGVLLYGPPGTGKTLVAKAVATSCSLNFFSVKGPELLNMYIGESEANVRRVFQRARDAKPCVIFFDELDSVAPKRGNQGDSGGVMDRIVSQLLAELDGMSSGGSGADVFVIGATNRPDLLDPALLRPGRFDRMLYLGVSQTHDAQLDILEALTRKFQLESGLDLQSIADKCPFNYTGADFYALCADAMLNAMSRTAEAVEKKITALNANTDRDEHLPYPITPQYFLAELATEADIQVRVSLEDFEYALRNLVPSVSQVEMEHYAQVQQRFSQSSEVDEQLST